MYTTEKITDVFFISVYVVALAILIGIQVHHHGFVLVQPTWVYIMLWVIGTCMWGMFYGLAKICCHLEQQFDEENSQN